MLESGRECAQINVLVFRSVAQPAWRKAIRKVPLGLVVQKRPKAGQHPQGVAAHSSSKHLLNLLRPFAPDVRAPLQPSLHRTVPDQRRLLWQRQAASLFRHALPALGEDGRLWVLEAVREANGQGDDAHNQGRNEEDL